MKLMKEECENNFDGYRDINEEEMSTFMKEKLSELPSHQLLKQIKLTALL